LVEQRLAHVLDDTWYSKGIHEAANLLFDIAKAVKYLHDNQLVHGDIKPDNIGRKGDTYVLLDFGICRPADEFSAEVTPTGSLRTRAPELIVKGCYIDPYKVDVWALGATVFNAIAQRYPLIASGESIPRVSDPDVRQIFEDGLAQRITAEWDKWVNLHLVPEPIRGILDDMLKVDPHDRITASEILRRCSAELVAFLRSTDRDEISGGGRFSALDEFKQIAEYLSDDGIGPLMPANRRQKLYARVSELKRMPGFDDVAKRKLDDLLVKLG
jgi:serine/threonine protein kinase